MNPLIVACLTGVAVLVAFTAVVVRNRRVRNGK
jgi:hypothetical protein